MRAFRVAGRGAVAVPVIWIGPLNAAPVVVSDNLTSAAVGPVDSEMTAAAVGG